MAPCSRAIRVGVKSHVWGTGLKANAQSTELRAQGEELFGCVFSFDTLLPFASLKDSGAKSLLINRASQRNHEMDLGAFV